MEVARMKGHFNDIADIYETQIPQHMRLHYLNKKTEHMLKYLNKNREMRGIDVGCGLGRYVEFLSRSAGSIVGVDNSKKMISLARKSFQSRNAFFYPLTQHIFHLKAILSILHIR